MSIGHAHRNFIRRLRRGPQSPHQRLWQAMRILREFTNGELASVADASESTTRTYVSILARAGFIRSQPSAGITRRIYRLVRDSGPVCPAIVRLRQGVFDFNTEQEYPL